MSKDVRIGDALGYGWNTTISNLGRLFAIYLLYAVITAAASGPRNSRMLPEGIASDVVETILWLAETLLSFWLSAGFILFFLLLVRFRPPDVATIFKGGSYFLKYMFASVLTWLLMAVAFIPGAVVIVIEWFWLIFGSGLEPLQQMTDAPSIQNWLEFVEQSGISLIVALIFIGIFIIPPFYVSVMVMFAPYLIVDRGLGPIEAMKASARITKGGRMGLINFMVVSWFVYLAGALALLVGLLVAMPVVQIATVWLYVHLIRQTEHQLGETIGDPDYLTLENHA